MYKHIHKNRDYPGKTILLHDEEYLRKHMTINDKINIAFLSEEEEELFLMGVIVDHMKKKCWGKIVTDIYIDSSWDGLENIIGRIHDKSVTIQPWMVSRLITIETDPEYFI